MINILNSNNDTKELKSQLKWLYKKYDEHLDSVTYFDKELEIAHRQTAYYLHEIHRMKKGLVCLEHKSRLTK